MDKNNYSEEMHKVAVAADSDYRGNLLLTIFFTTFFGLLIITIGSLLALWMIQPSQAIACINKGGSWIPIVTSRGLGGNVSETRMGCVMPAALHVVQTINNPDD